MAPDLSVEVAYARPDIQRILVITIEPGTTAREALQLSGLAEVFPEIDVACCPIGVFGQHVVDDYVLRDGDRVEVYRPLTRDPRDTRRELASQGKTMRDTQGKGS